MAMAAETAQRAGIGQARALAGIEARARGQVGDIAERSGASRRDDALRGGFRQAMDLSQAQTQRKLRSRSLPLPQWLFHWGRGLALQVEVRRKLLPLPRQLPRRGRGPG